MNAIVSQAFFCGIEGCDEPRYLKYRLCWPHHYAKHRARMAARQRERWLRTHPEREPACAFCGDTFVTTDTRKKFCSVLCMRRDQYRRYWAAGTDRWAPKVRGKQRQAVLERDQWRCRICSAVIDRTLKFPHVGSATIDHRIPLARGGPHEMDNWQAAHFACNRDKGATA